MAMASPSADDLARAAATGDRLAVRRLLDNGVHVQAPNSYGRTALQVSRLCDPNLLEDLLIAGSNPNLQDRQTKATVCHDVARSGYLETLQVLLRYGTDILCRDAWGNTPAHVAAKNGNFLLVRLLAFGMDVREVNHEGLSPLDYLESVEDAACRQWVERAKYSPRTLQSCCVVQIRKQLGGEGLRQLRTDPACPDGVKTLVFLQSNPPRQPFPET